MPLPPLPFRDDTADPAVCGSLHTPESANGHALVLTHGAGGNAQAVLLVALAETFCTAGFTVLRCNLPYRQVRSFGPPGPGDAARDRAGLKNAIAAIRKTMEKNFRQNEVAPSLSRSLRQDGNLLPDQAAPPNAKFVGWEGRIFLAGHSYGGRQSSMLCAELAGKQNEGAPPNAKFVGWEGRIFLAGHSYGGRQSSMLCAELAESEFAQNGPEVPAGLLLLSYPLHPPRRPEQQRTQHLPNLRTPTLFVHGTRDPFGSIAELEQALKMIPAKTKLLPVEGAGHDLGFKGKAKKEELPRAIFSEFSDFFALSS